MDLPLFALVTAALLFSMLVICFLILDMHDYLSGVVVNTIAKEEVAGDWQDSLVSRGGGGKKVTKVCIAAPH